METWREFYHLKYTVNNEEARGFHGVLKNETGFS